MPESSAASAYYILDVRCPDRMRIYDLADPDPGEDLWFGGAAFRATVPVPVVATIRKDHEHDQLLPWFPTGPLASDAFYQALLDAGVDNLQAYDAVLRSVDGKVEHRGYKAVNVIGVVRAADLSRTEFSPLSPSRLVDAHIDRLAIDPAKARGLLMFRLAENVSAVVVHERVKEVLEQRRFPFVVFTQPADFVS